MKHNITNNSVLTLCNHDLITFLWEYCSK